MAEDDKNKLDRITLPTQISGGLPEKTRKK